MERDIQVVCGIRCVIVGGCCLALSEGVGFVTANHLGLYMIRIFILMHTLGTSGSPLAGNHRRIFRAVPRVALKRFRKRVRDFFWL